MTAPDIKRRGSCAWLDYPTSTQIVEPIYIKSKSQPIYETQESTKMNTKHLKEVVFENMFIKHNTSNRKVPANTKQIVHKSEHKKLHKREHKKKTKSSNTIGGSKKHNKPTHKIRCRSVKIMATETLSLFKMHSNMTKSPDKHHERHHEQLPESLYDELATYQSAVYGNNQMALAKQSTHKPIAKQSGCSTIAQKRKHKSVKMDLLLKKLKKRMISKDELSSVMISKHKMRLTVFDKIHFTGGIYDVFKGIMFEINFKIQQEEMYQVPEIYCVSTPIPNHPNIDCKTGLVSMYYFLNKHWVKSKKKYTDKVWSVIIDLIKIIKHPSLHDKTDILNKKAIGNISKGKFLPHRDEMIGFVKDKDVWANYIDLDLEYHEMKKDRKHVHFQAEQPAHKTQIVEYSIDFNSNQMMKIAATMKSMDHSKNVFDVVSGLKKIRK